MDLVQRLNQHHPKIIDLSLDRIFRLLDLLDNPQNLLPPLRILNKDEESDLLNNLEKFNFSLKSSMAA